VVACASSGKSQTVSPFFPCFSAEDDKQGVGVFLWKNNFTLRSENLFKAALSSPKKQQSKRVLKRSNPLFFQEMTHGASTRGCFFVIFLAPASNFLNGCPK
jgi:hypothetical protein